MRGLLLFLLLTIPVAAQSVDNSPPFDDWQFVGKGENQYGTANIFIAPKTIARNGDIIKVWLGVTFPSGSFLMAAWHGSAPMPQVSLLRTSVVFDCKGGTVQTNQTLLYNQVGRVVLKSKKKETVKEQAGTVSWFAFEYFCEQGEAPTHAPTLKPK